MLHYELRLLWDIIQNNKIHLTKHLAPYARPDRETRGFP